MARPTFDTYGVASHALNRRSGEQVDFVRRVSPSEASIGVGGYDVVYLVRFADGEEVEVFADEIVFPQSEERGPV